MCHQGGRPSKSHQHPGEIWSLHPMSLLRVTWDTCQESLDIVARAANYYTSRSVSPGWKTVHELSSWWNPTSWLIRAWRETRAKTVLIVDSPRCLNQLSGEHYTIIMADDAGPYEVTISPFEYIFLVPNIVVWNIAKKIYGVGRGVKGQNMAWNGPRFYIYLDSGPSRDPKWIKDPWNGLKSMMWQLNIPTNIYKSSNNKKYRQISTNLPTVWQCQQKSTNLPTIKTVPTEIYKSSNKYLQIFQQ